MSGTEFEATLDEAQEYLQLQEELGTALRAGFLSLAQARYAMGADRVSTLQLPAHMAATARLLGSAADGQLELVRRLAKPGLAPSSRGSSSASVAAPLPAEPAGGPAAAAQDGDKAATTAAEPASAGAAPAMASQGLGVEDALQRLRLAAQQSDSFVEQLAAKYCSGEGGSGDAGSADSSAAVEPGELDGEYAEVAAPGRPLHWFGSLVAPSLRDAEAHFGQALERAVAAANAAARLRRGVDGHGARAGM